jgi:hypothetical protein
VGDEYVHVAVDDHSRLASVKAQRPQRSEDELP